MWHLQPTSEAAGSSSSDCSSALLVVVLAGVVNLALSDVEKMVPPKLGNSPGINMDRKAGGVQGRPTKVLVTGIMMGSPFKN